MADGEARGALAQVVWRVERARPRPRIWGGVGGTSGAIVALTLLMPILGLLDAAPGAMALAGASTALAGAGLGFLFVRGQLRARDHVRLGFGARGLEIGDSYVAYERVRGVELEREDDRVALQIHTHGGGYRLTTRGSVRRDLEDAITRVAAAHPGVFVRTGPTHADGESPAAGGSLARSGG